MLVEGEGPEQAALQALAHPELVDSPLASWGSIAMESELVMPSTKPRKAPWKALGWEAP